MLGGSGGGICFGWAFVCLALLVLSSSPGWLNCICVSLRALLPPVHRISPTPNFVCGTGTHVLCKPQFFLAVFITRSPRQVYPTSSALRFRLKRKNFRAGTVGFGWSSLHLARVMFSSSSSSSRSSSFSPSSFVLLLLLLLPPSNALPCCVSSATRNKTRRS